MTHNIVVIGAGPGGERAAILAGRSGRRVALIEREHEVGGARILWGTIPSKTLRESALFVHALTLRKLDAIRCEVPGEITIADFMHRERMVVQRELELAHRALNKYNVELFAGRGRFVDAHTVAVLGVDGQERLRLSGETVVIATGSTPNRPADVPFDDELVFDSNTILGLPRLPRSMVVLGAGVIGIEYASIFAALGISVTLLDTRTELLPYLDREIAGLLERELQQLSIAVLHDERYRAITRLPGDRPAARVETRSGKILEADAVLYCVGRDGNTRDLGLESVGLCANSRGLIDVNEYYQTAVPNIYAVGDVIGYPALASTSMEQGRQAIRHAYNIPGPKGRTELLPFAIYAIPEVSYIGETQEQLEARGASYVVGRGSYELNPRGQITGATGGMLKLLFERPELRLAGVHVVGANASEIVHIGQAFLSSRAGASQIAETLYNYPTLSDLYRHAALEALIAAG